MKCFKQVVNFLYFQSTVNCNKGKGDNSDPTTVTVPFPGVLNSIINNQLHYQVHQVTT